MLRLVSIPLCLFTLLATASAGETRMTVVRHHNYELSKLLKAKQDRSEATTEAIRARARSIETRRELDEARLDAIREARIPQGERTLGRACIYGPNDEVLYQPAGKRC